MKRAPAFWHRPDTRLARHVCCNPWARFTPRPLHGPADWGHAVASGIFRWSASAISMLAGTGKNTNSPWPVVEHLRDKYHTPHCGFRAAMVVR